MAAHDSDSPAISYSMQEPSLRAMAPPSLQRAGHLRPQFVAVNGKREFSLNTLQRESLNRAAGETGSRMVKREKPFPELKPKKANEIKAAFFNQAWMQEQRRAMLARFEDQAHAAPRQKRRSEPVLER